MKCQKLIFIFWGWLVVFNLISCADVNTEKSNEPSSASKSNLVLQEGATMIEQFQCTACHKVDEDLTGPSYKNVATKYKDADSKTIKALAQKVIEGGSGVWGQTVMNPHPNISKEDAKKMIEYILNLNE